MGIRTLGRDLLDTTKNVGRAAIDALPTSRADVLTAVERALHKGEVGAAMVRHGLQSLAEHQVLHTPLEDDAPGTLSDRMLQEDLSNRFVTKPPTFVDAIGPFLIDKDGHYRLDCSTGVAVDAVGHRHPRIEAAIAGTTMSNIATYWRTKDFAAATRLLKEQLGLGPESRVMYKVDGSGGVAFAVKAARVAHQVKRHRDKIDADPENFPVDQPKTWVPKLIEQKNTLEAQHAKIVVFDSCFHGRDTTVIQATGVPKYANASAAAGQHFIMSKFASTPDEEPGAIGAITALLEEDTDNNIAAVMIEPVQGEGGVRPATPGFLKALRELCDKHDKILIFDCVQSGTYRTGKPRSYENDEEDIQPDIVAYGKAVGGGSFPVAPVISNYDSVAQYVHGGIDGSTFGAHPLGLATTKAMLEIAEEENLDEEARRKGEYLLEKLKEMAEDNDFIESVQGEGLMIGIKIRDGATDENGDQVNGSTIRDELLQGDGFTYRGRKYRVTSTPARGGSTLRLVPPLNVDDELLEAMLPALARALKVPDWDKYENPELMKKPGIQEIMQTTARSVSRMVTSLRMGLSSQRRTEEKWGN